MTLKADYVRQRGVRDSLATSCLAALHEAVRSLGLAGAEIRCRRECVVADCLAQLRQCLDEHGVVWLRFDRGSLDFCGVSSATATTPGSCASSCKEGSYVAYTSMRRTMTAI